ncbi:MAG: thiamine pyrophosphate-binding protein [Roseburia sp.]|nr:thiamine pyrophosphate-binding protein [Roseburia sp.]
MKIRVADYVAQFCVEKGMTDVFSVVGGGSMFLNDALGHREEINCTYNHHEQASTMAAEAYYKYKGKMPLVCVTTGPGGTNTVTGLLGAWQDSIPLFVISGQVRYETTVGSTGLNLRQFGGQEHQIVETIGNVTKYARMVTEPQDIRYELEKAYAIAMSGRRGPVWLDIPLNVQGTEVEEKSLRGYDETVEEQGVAEYADTILEELRKAKRPLIVAGSAIRTVGKVDAFVELVKKLDIPVTYPLNVPDVISAENERAVGCFGGVGNRAANFTVQNADLLIVFGCRMAFAHIGFNYQKFSPNSKKITIDIDEAEQEKPTMKRDIKVTADVGKVIDELLNREISLPDHTRWNAYCSYLKEKYPIFQEHHKISEDNRVNPYYLAKSLSDRMEEDGIVVLGNSSGLDPMLQMGAKKQGGRIILNCNCGSMGYCLPAGIGAAVASGKQVVVYTGDGCIQMNIQELQTIIHNRLSIKIVILNNGGYGGVVATQNNFFEGRHSGCTKDSGISMPDFEKIAYAYGYKYFKIATHSDVEPVLDELLADNVPAICEVMQDLKQDIEPCVSSRKLEDGTIISTGIDDLYPFLDMEEYEGNQYHNWEQKLYSENS